MRSSIFLFMFCALISTSGCTKSPAPVAPDPVPPGPSDQALIEAEIGRQAALVEDLAYEGSAYTPVDFTPRGGQPYGFRRVIPLRDRSLEFRFFDIDTIVGQPLACEVTLRRRLSGDLVIAFNDVYPGTTRSTGWFERKPLADVWGRRLVFRRHTVAGDTTSQWRLEAMSPVVVRPVGLAGEPKPPPSLLSLRIEAPGLDTTLTSVDVKPIDEMLRLEAGWDVTLTAQTLADDDVVTLFQGEQRERFGAVGEGRHTLVWRVPESDVPIHLGVNAFTRPTLYDPRAAYESEAVIHPIRVAAVSAPSNRTSESRLGR